MNYNLLHNKHHIDIINETIYAITVVTFIFQRYCLNCHYVEASNCFVMKIYLFDIV